MKPTNSNQNLACARFETVIADMLFGDATEAQEQDFQRHAAECPACHQQLASLQQTLVEASKRAVVEPRPEALAGFADRLDARIRSDGLISTPGVVRPMRRSGVSLVRSLPRWSLQIAAGLVLLTVGVFWGRSLGPVEPGPFAGTDTIDAELVAVESRAHSYLDRSKTLLLGLVNFDAASEDPASLGGPQRQQIAQELLSEASFLKSRLTQSEQQRLRSLVSDLEVILLQLANMERQLDIPEIEIVRAGVDRGALLFKIDVEKMRRSDPATTGTQPKKAAQRI
ncbi:MAG: hypothetical protein ACI80V_000154 [Rhodothermales bacterium]|jgi:hypothetical protein